MEDQIKSYSKKLDVLVSFKACIENADFPDVFTNNKIVMLREINYQIEQVQNDLIMALGLKAYKELNNIGEDQWT